MFSRHLRTGPVAQFETMLARPLVPILRPLLLSSLNITPHKAADSWSRVEVGSVILKTVVCLSFPMLPRSVSLAGSSKLSGSCLLVCRGFLQRWAACSPTAGLTSPATFCAVLT